VREKNKERKKRVMQRCVGRRDYKGGEKAFFFFSFSVFPFS
jgi:hypothetical protein